MKTVNPKAFKDYEYRAERSQEKKQTRQMRDQRKGKTNRWVIAD